MTIDPRYLVPETCLPFFPSSVPAVWLDAQGRPTAWPGLHSVAHLDLSAPPKRDGIPERLDVLPWALDLLAKRYGVIVEDIGDLRPMSCSKRKSWDLHPWGGRYVPVLTSDDPGWEPYDGDDLDQPRRIVAAALRNVAPKEAP